jgi:hypothetical protein
LSLGYLVVGLLWDVHVSGDAFVKASVGEDAECGGEVLFSI